MRWRWVACLFGLITSAIAVRGHAEDATFVPPINSGSLWKITKASWAAEDESRFAAFIQALGRDKCGSLDACLKSTANPYRHTDAHGAYFGDCADLPYFLRGYFAWKNGLPFSYQREMRTVSGRIEDPRYSSQGNYVYSRRDALTEPGDGPKHAPSFLRQIHSEVSTAMFRTNPETGGGAFHDDFYTVDISREAIQPGVLAYDIYGHAGIVFEIEDDGRIHIMASHPDHSLTRSTYGPNFLRSAPELGGGLKAWRPIRVEGAEAGPDGQLIGGRIIAAANSDLPHFSLVQFFGNAPHPSGDWRLGEFRIAARTVDYYDFVRRSLAAPGFAYDPIRELRGSMRQICRAIKQRKVAVDRGLRAGIDRLPHPQKLPANIYGTYGEWESFSTPSRDARLKTLFVELRRLAQSLVEGAIANDPSINYDGENLAADLLETYADEASACRIVYTKSNGDPVALGFDDVAARLFDLSFDPYHCIERRWGAKGAEAASCGDGDEKTRWYEAQQYLRNQAARTYDVRMDFTVDELQSPDAASIPDGGVGWANAPDVDTSAYLASAAVPNLGEAAVEAAVYDPSALPFSANGLVYGN